MDIVLYRYQLLPPWDRDPDLQIDRWNAWQDDVDELLEMEARGQGLYIHVKRYRGDELSALMRHLNQMQGVSWRWNRNGEFYDIRIYKEESHSLVLEWAEKFPKRMLGCELVKGRLEND